MAQPGVEPCCPADAGHQSETAAGYPLLAGARPLTSEVAAAAAAAGAVGQTYAAAAAVADIAAAVAGSQADTGPPVTLVHHRRRQCSRHRQPGQGWDSCAAAILGSCPSDCEG